MASEESLRESSSETRSKTRSERSGDISGDNPTSEIESVLWKVAIPKGLRNTAQTFGTTLLKMWVERKCCVDYATMNILTLEQRVTLQII